ncbi:MAG: hypothetical protein KBD00_03565 [Candidatus Peribacteraceae bacterium]|nr:hypothetical protein [Candidatus Peribacteraceae bacterium]
MPQTNTTTNLEEEIRVSRLLRDDEKTHWLTTLATMTHDQREKLAAILASAATLPWNSEMETYVKTNAAA